MEPAQCDTLGNALLGKLMELRLQERYRIAARAGMDVSGVSESDAQRNVPVNNAIARAFSSLDMESRRRALPILADAIATSNQHHQQDLNRLLHQHGYEYINGSFVPVGLIDEREAPFLPPTALTDLAKAISRLADNDQSGAITAACGAVDATTTALYEKHGLGEASAPFQAKVNTALNRLGVFEKLKQDLIEIGIKPSDAKKIADETGEATKHAVEALQVIRRTNGDVHGTKPTYTRVVYNTIKWSSAVCGLLEGE
jgi:hypothetical protein